MKSKDKTVFTSVLFVVFGAGVTNAVEKGALSVYWRHETDGTTVKIEPPGDGWNKLADGGQFTKKVKYGEVIWLACKNEEKKNFRKTWEITIDSNDAAKKPHKFFGGGTKVYAYFLRSGAWTSVEIPKKTGKGKNRYSRHVDGTKWTIKAEIGPPQPAWEALRLKRLAAGKEITLTVTATSECWKAVKIKDPLDVGESLGLSKSIGAKGAMVREVALTELALFPVDVPVYAEPELPPTLLAPPETGTWTYRFAYIDPDGVPRPQGGVWWSTDGPGIAAAETFEMTLLMVGEGDDTYLFFAHDDKVDAWLSDTLYIGSDSIPTVSEWGIAIMALLLLIGGKVYFSRRRLGCGSVSSLRAE